MKKRATALFCFISLVTNRDKLITEIFSDMQKNLPYPQTADVSIH